MQFMKYEILQCFNEFSVANWEFPLSPDGSGWAWSCFNKRAWSGLFYPSCPASISLKWLLLIKWKLHCLFMRKSGGLIGVVRLEFLCFRNQAMNCVANLYLLPTQYCICIRWRMMKVPGCGVAGQKLILALFDHFIFTSQARILAEWTQSTRFITHFIQPSFHFFTQNRRWTMEGRNWFETNWTRVRPPVTMSSKRRYRGLSLSSFRIIKCKSLASLRGFRVYGVFYWGFWPSQIDTGGCCLV